MEPGSAQEDYEFAIPEGGRYTGIKPAMEGHDADHRSANLISNKADSNNMDSPEESDIIEFYKDKSILITGVTGFLGKVLLEKLLRSCPTVKNIYLLIRPKRGSTSKERLQEILASEIFDLIRNKQPSALEKLVAIDGDLTEPNLGLKESEVELLANEISIVFHSAAQVKFNETLRHAVEMNLEGTRKIIELCHKMKNLVSIVHVSTAYCNCDRKEVDEKIYPPSVHPHHVISCTKWMEDKLLGMITPQLLGDKPNTYTFTKCLAESLVAEEGAGLPIAIVRPSIVTASWREPFPGWVDNFNGPTSLLASCASGLMTTVISDNTCVADLIPVDLVVNLLIVVAWYTATTKDSKAPVVYNCVSGTLNKIYVSKIKKYLNKWLQKYPFQNTLTCPKLEITNSRFYQAVVVFFRNYLPALAYDFIRKCNGKKPRMVRLIQKSRSAMESLQFFTTRQWKFPSNNLVLLNERLSSWDKETFKFDIRQLEWESYMENYTLGVRKFLFKQDPSTISESRKKLKRQHLFHQIYKGIILLGFLRLILLRTNLARHLWYLISNLVGRIYKMLPSVV